MKQRLHKPPAILDSAVVLEYALRDRSVKYSGHSCLFVGGKELGPVPCLALCRNLGDRCILLFHCSRDWKVLGAVEYESVAKAKARAEEIYPGLSTFWIKIPPAERRKELANSGWADQECSFCGRKPYEVDRLITKREARICNLCIAEFQQMLRDE